MSASSSASWSRFSLPSNFVNGHVSTMWFMVCRLTQSQEDDWARPHLCKLARHGPWPVRKRFLRDHVWRGRSKPGCRIVGSVTIVWLTTEARDQSSLNCVIIVSTFQAIRFKRWKCIQLVSISTVADALYDTVWYQALGYLFTTL